MIPAGNRVSDDQRERDEHPDSDRRDHHTDQPVARLQGTDAFDPRPAKSDGDFARMFLATGLVNDLTLSVIPELRLTDGGLVDVTRFAYVPVEVGRGP